MRKYSAIIFLFVSNICMAQADSIKARIILIGDAGQLTYGREPAIDAARNLIPLDTNTTVLYLGDNIYNAGLPDDMMPGYSAAQGRIGFSDQHCKRNRCKSSFYPRQS